MKVTQAGFIEGAAAATPPTGIVAIYAKTDGALYSKDDAGTELALSGSGGGSVTSVTSANADLSIATPTTTPVITVVQTPALRSATTTVNVSSATAPTSGQVLTATSGTAATWQNAASAGTFPKFSATPSETQTIFASTLTKVNFGTEEFDTNSNYDTSLSRFTPTVSGYYCIIAKIFISGTNYSFFLRKNGSAHKTLAEPASEHSSSASAILFMNGTTDYVEIFAILGSTDGIDAGEDTYFQGFRVS